RGSWASRTPRARGVPTRRGAGQRGARSGARPRRHGLDARFEGFVSRARLDALLREAACVVLASRRGEGLPNAVLEAMAYARPVVATSVAGVTGLIEDGVNGLLAPADDPRAL